MLVERTELSLGPLRPASAVDVASGTMSPVGNLMRVTVPSFAAGVLLSSEPELLEALTPYGRKVGEAVELDLVAVGERGGEAGLALGSLLARYVWQCRSFWAGWSHGQAAGRYVRVRRLLAEAVQRSTKSCKQDLALELDALMELAGVGDLIEELTGPEPDFESLSGRFSTFGSLTRDGTRTTVTLALEGIDAWPQCLGGAPSAGELRRLLTVQVMHAAWRDRRNRRVTRVRVEADEVWPEPNPLPEGLASDVRDSLAMADR